MIGPDKDVAMIPVGYFSGKARQREKQEARDRDERLLASGELSLEQVAEKNGFFSVLDRSQVRVVSWRANLARHDR